MKKSISVLITCLLVLFIAGCASVKFYSDAGLTNKTGVKYFTSKPYLVMERDINNNTVVKATVIYLPDLSKPQYVVFKTGIGSSKANLTLADGVLTTVGLEADTKIPETVDSFAGLIEAAAKLAEDVPRDTLGLPTVVAEMYEILITTEGTTLRKVQLQ